MNRKQFYDMTLRPTAFLDCGIYTLIHKNGEFMKMELLVLHCYGVLLESGITTASKPD